jgi:hypothetical protein
MGKSGIVYLALVPLVAPEAGVITEVATIIGKDPYGTRLLLAGKVPKIIAHYEGKQTAESVAQRLRDLGLVPILCTESKREMKSRGVFLIIKGREETYVTKERTETTRKFSLGRTALTGGIPMWRTEKKQVKESSAVTKYFARLYTRKSSEPAVEIIHNQTDYSFLKGEMASSSLVNFNIVVTKLQQTFPKAIFDDNLMRASIKQAHGPSGAEDTEINCKLLYLQYLVVKP